MRIGLPSGASLPPFVDWPEDLASLVRAEVVMLEGGHEFDGRPLGPFDARGMRAAARRIREAGIRPGAVAAVAPIVTGRVDHGLLDDFAPMFEIVEPRPEP